MPIQKLTTVPMGPFLYIGKVIFLAILYIVTGKLGLLLAVPPGYATIIWPASGIAIGMLLLHGWKLWPGILIGSFLLNCCISGAYSPDEGLVAGKTIAALFIAVGSTIQALFAYGLIHRFIGVPLQFENTKKILQLFVLAGPCACLVAATVGVGTLVGMGIMPYDKIAGNWLTWWAGDMFGVFIFLPLLLIFPSKKNNVTWRGSRIGTLPLLAMMTIFVPLGLTFYMWKISSENTYQSSLAQFNTLAQESEKALLGRIDSYNYALLGGAGFFQGSQFVSRKEWATYVDTIDIRNNFPGMNGLGLITPLDPSQAEKYTQIAQSEGFQTFEIYPQPENVPIYVIGYIEPLDINLQAMGLNIAFEENRRHAAEFSRDTGLSTITKRIVLVQDEQKSSGFLLLHPVYYLDQPISSIEERARALRGWVYSPLIAEKFLKDLTHSQGRDFKIEIYDGSAIADENLIYAGGDVDDKGEATPIFRIEKTINIMQQQWTVVWSSTPTYEHMHRSNNHVFILVSGLLFTGLFALFLITSSIRSAETIELITEKRKVIFPLVIFVMAAAGSIYLYDTLVQQEYGYIENMAHEESNKIERLLVVQVNEKLLSLERMAQRWEASGGTPEQQWRADAKNFVSQMKGLRAVEWVDSTYHVKMVEPAQGNEKAVGLNILFNKEREAALKGAAAKNTVTLTPPLDLVQGYKAILAYFPAHINNVFQGFVVGILSIEDFFGSIISRETGSHYAVYLSYNGNEFYKNKPSQEKLDKTLSVTRTVQLYDKEISVRIVPTREFVARQRTSLPFLVLGAGLLIAGLLSLTVRAILISKIRAHYLKASEETFRSAMDHASIGMALVSLEGGWLRVNGALCDLIGYDEEELLKTNFQAITPPDDLGTDLELLQKVLRNEIQTYQMEKRYFHKNGHIIWVLLSVSLVRHPDGKPKHFISQIQDITERHEMDKMKNEFISIVSHELRTPLTSIRGSLGLIEGTLSKDLPDKVNYLLALAHKNTERLIALINDILDIDKIASGKMRFDIKDENLAELISSGVESNAGYAEQYKIRFECSEIPRDVNILVDAIRWQQIFSNILSNAAKFTSEGGLVKIFVTDNGDTVRVSVQDQGPGIADEFKSRIFGKFSQENSSLTRSKGGSGLGLNISKQLTESMGGQIGFVTEVGVGSTFWIEFPKAKLERWAQIPKFNFASELAARDHDDRPKILHVEDDEDFSDLIAASMVEKARVVSAKTFAEAQALLQKENFSLILLDIALPDKSGLNLIDYVREIKDEDVPIVVLSADEPPPEFHDRLRMFMVKSRLSEKKIVSTILDLLNDKS